MIQNDLQDLVQSLRRKNLHIGFAESCTGGLLSAELTKQAGVSDVFLGSIVSYANQVKKDLLGVGADSLMQEGAVSEIVALEMVRGVRAQFKAETAIAITGIAGPGGGTSQKPVGTVWLAVSGPDFEVAEKKHFNGTREQIQQQAALAAVQLMNDVLKGHK